MREGILQDTSDAKVGTAHDWNLGAYIPPMRYFHFIAMVVVVVIHNERVSKTMEQPLKV